MGPRRPSREEIGAAFSGHLCRCGAYDNIYRAVADACAGLYDQRGAEAPRLEARAKGDRRRGLHARHPPRRPARRRDPALAARRAPASPRSTFAAAQALPGVKAAVSLLDDDRMVTFVGDARRRGGGESTSRRPNARWRRSASPTSRCRRRSARRRRWRRARADRVPARQGRQAQRRRRRQRAGRLERQSARAGVGVLASPQGGAEGDRRRARRRATRCSSKACSAPARSSTIRWSRTPPSPISTATQLTVEVSTQAVSALAEAIAKRFKLEPAKRARAGASMSAAASAPRRRWAWRPSPRSRSPRPPARRCGSPTAATRSSPSPAIGRRWN